ncbi:MAG TPA: hypothetical protein VHP31_08420 [Caproicibacter sp.]|nr:hypothetical protein [Caproicibacter sp.]
METIFHNDIFCGLLYLLIFYAAALVCSVATFIIGLVKKWNPQELLHINMVIKLIHIPAYILIFIIGLVCLLTIFTFAISIVLMILDSMTIFLSGLIGLGGIIRSYSENKLSKKAAVMHGILQFVFCADVISSIIVYRKVKIAKQNYENKQCLHLN